jgi:hypothetical protein
MYTITNGVIKIHTELNTDKPLISQISRYHGYLRVKHTELNTDKPLISQMSFPWKPQIKYLVYYNYLCNQCLAPLML